jgi:hypothetical protein
VVTRLTLTTDKCGTDDRQYSLSARTQQWTHPVLHTVLSLAVAASGSDSDRRGRRDGRGQQRP